MYSEMKLRMLSLVLAIVMLLSLAGCTQDNAQTIPNPNEAKGEIVVTDHLNREVKFEKRAEKIVSGYYITSSMMIALGLEDKVVGIEAKPQVRNIYKLAAPRFLEVPTVGSMKEFDLEGTAALNPDLVVLSVRLKDSVESLEKLGIKVIAVNPESTEGLFETLDMIGKATGTEERANKIKSYFDEKLGEIEKQIEGKERVRVYLGGNSDFLSTASSKMYQNTLIENAGGENVAKDIDDTYWANISYEQLITYNPDVIVVVPGASYTREDILKDERLKRVKAVEENQVYMMPDNIEMWDSPLPSGILGTMWLNSVLHEDVYSFDKFKDDAFDFYKEFYDIEINKDDITK